MQLGSARACNVHRRTPVTLQTYCRTAGAGFTIELCAGLVDKAKPLEVIVAEEIAEECGYLVEPGQVTAIGSAISAAGTSGSEHYMYYATVRGRRQQRGRVGGGGAFEQHGVAWLLAQRIYRQCSCKLLLQLAGRPAPAVRSHVRLLQHGSGLMCCTGASAFR
jgi:8-oxo-dGTP pyrophosphatase MutT (NUDIX family)